MLLKGQHAYYLEISKYVTVLFQANFLKQITPSCYRKGSLIKSFFLFFHIPKIKTAASFDKREDKHLKIKRKKKCKICIFNGGLRHSSVKVTKSKNLLLIFPYVERFEER